ncbi:hypothetical protein GH714_017766 [Hevea brasiliensis]|uniref:Endonuclease/exonuclease/phosphatase domain-containing protein n=1 Tax=Hevea brasiliensis TaxID=3981 RepID=A0A6A6MAU5_HEVBR|nr:hypothetical protein GH714_017766 [Hevea brasiliensis]
MVFSFNIVALLAEPPLTSTVHAAPVESSSLPNVNQPLRARQVNLDHVDGYPHINLEPSGLEPIVLNVPNPPLGHVDQPLCPTLDSGALWLLFCLGTVEGLEDVPKSHLRKHIRKSNPDLLAILETKFEVMNFSVIRRLGGMVNSDRTSSSSDGRSAGILAIWNKDSVMVSEVRVFNNWILLNEQFRKCEFQSLVGLIYAPCEVGQQESFWQHVAQTPEATNSPILLMGDFNQVLSSRERSSGSASLVDLWDEICRNSPSSSLPVKLKLPRIKLKDWNKNVFGHIDSKFSETMKLLDQWESTAEVRSLSPQEQQYVQELSKEKQLWASRTECFWRQKSRMLWCKLGDRNMKIFHIQCSNCWRKNSITQIVADGQLLSGKKMFVVLF